MKKLNKKGMTIAELVVSFLLVGVAVVYFYNTVDTVYKVYSETRVDTQEFVDKDYAMRMIDASEKTTNIDISKLGAKNIEEELTFEVIDNSFNKYTFEINNSDVSYYYPIINNSILSGNTYSSLKLNLVNYYEQINNELTEIKDINSIIYTIDEDSNWYVSAKLNNKSIINNYKITDLKLSEIDNKINKHDDKNYIYETAKTKYIVPKNIINKNLKLRNNNNIIEELMVDEEYNFALNENIDLVLRGTFNKAAYIDINDSSVFSFKNGVVSYCKNGIECEYDISVNTNDNNDYTITIKNFELNKIEYYSMDLSPKPIKIESVQYTN